MSNLDRLTKNNDTIRECLDKANNLPNVPVDVDKIINKTARGTGIVVLDDVSEVNHNVSVQLSSDTVTDFSGVAVEVSASNLIPFLYADMGLTEKGITATVNEDGSITFNGTATAEGVFTVFNSLWNGTSAIPVKGTYTLSGVAGGSSSTYYLQPYIDGVSQSVLGTGATTYEWDGNLNLVRFYYKVGTVFNNATIYPMLNYGDVAAPYEKFAESETYTANAKGVIEGIKSTSPYMAILAPENVDISVSYHQSYGLWLEYNRFWDAFLEKGARTNYQYAFSGSGWTPATFRPKYDIVVKTRSDYMFAMGLNLPKDFVTLFADLGVTLDTSRSTNVTYMFYYAGVHHLGVIDTSSAPNLPSTFNACSAQTIDKLILKDDGTQVFGNTFNACSNLKNITIEGTIGQSINFSACPLTPESMVSIIRHLKNYVDTDMQYTQTLIFSEACWDALEAAIPNESPQASWRLEVAYEYGWNT